MQDRGYRSYTGLQGGRQASRSRNNSFRVAKTIVVIEHRATSTQRPSAARSLFTTVAIRRLPEYIIRYSGPLLSAAQRQKFRLASSIEPNNAVLDTTDSFAASDLPPDQSTRHVTHAHQSRSEHSSDYTHTQAHNFTFRVPNIIRHQPTHKCRPRPRLFGYKVFRGSQDI